MRQDILGVAELGKGNLTGHLLINVPIEAVSRRLYM
jgi:hypothetical protein